MNSEYEAHLDIRLVHDFIYILILKKLKETSSRSGNDLIKHFRQECNLEVNSNTIYSTLHLLEKRGLIKGGLRGWRKAYKLTKQGEEFLDVLCTTLQSGNAASQASFPALQTQDFEQPISSETPSWGSVAQGWR